jgi:5'-3' exoribonuclease 1
MGIPGLFLHYYKKFKKQDELLITLDALKKSNIKYLFFDYNSLIHPCAQQILAANYDRYIAIDNKELMIQQIENDIIENCINYSQFVIDIVNVKSVYVVIDGVAPRSKMNQQRERRYKSHFFRDIESSSGKSKLWDSNKITPGTKFMDKMISSLKNWIIKHKGEINIVLSDSNDPGEGEHKMMRILNNKNFDNLNGNVCIYGLDADLIMLSMIHKRANNIILIRDNSFQDENSGISYLNIRSLKQYIVDDLTYKFKENDAVVRQQGTSTVSDVNRQGTFNEALIMDYILLCFLLGNDFLDHLFVLNIKDNGIDIVLKAYIKAYKGQSLVNIETLKSQTEWKKSINLIYLRDIFYQLKNYEEHFLKNRFQSGSNCYRKIDMQKIEEINLNQESNVYFYKDLINVVKGDTKNSDSKSTFVKGSESTEVKKQYYNFYNLHDTDSICFNYIEGLYWILGYYNGHIHDNWSWYYKYHNVPLCEDIFNYLRKYNINRIASDIYNSKYLNQSESYSCLKQLCLVLPRDSLINLGDNRFDKIIKHFNTNETSKYIINLFPTKVYVDIIGKEYLWQSKILFERINEDLLDILF